MPDKNITRENSGTLVVFDLEACAGDYSDLEKYIDKVSQQDVEFDLQTRVEK